MIIDRIKLKIKSTNKNPLIKKLKEKQGKLLFKSKNRQRSLLQAKALTPRSS